MGETMTKNENFKRFKFLEHTADVYIAAYGRTLEEAYANAGVALFEVMTDTSKVDSKVCEKIEVEGFDKQSLLYNWLEELLYLFEVKNLVFSKIRVQSISKKNDTFILTAEAWGEPFDPQKHEQRTLVKAVTYSLMEISEENGKYVVKFVLDI